MKFYYNGQLIRTSKNHTYTHAVINYSDGKMYCKGCSSSYEGAKKIIDTEKGYYTRQLNNYKAALEALEAGKNGYMFNEGRRKSYIKFGKDSTVERYKQEIEWSEKAVKSYDAWQIVELEAKEGKQ